MNTHIMNLNPEALTLIKNKQKTIEMRLYDNKRKEILIGDTIKFFNTEDPSIFLIVKVKELYIFKNFKDLYEKFDKVKLGYFENDIPNYTDMEKYYSKDNIKKYGVVGIEIDII